MKLTTIWLIAGAAFWAVTAYLIWRLGLSTAAFAGLGVPIGWAFAVYVAIPYQYRWMVKERQGREQDDHLNLRQTVALAVVGLILSESTNLLGHGASNGITILICATLGTVLILAARSKQLASVANRPWPVPPSEWDGEGRGAENHHKKRRRADG